MTGKRALLIVDLQIAFQPTEEMVRGFLDKAEEYDVVVATRFINGNPLFQRILNYPELNDAESKLSTLPPNSVVFEKTGYGLPIQLIDYLRSNAVTHVDVGGLETDACVLAAMFDLWDASIQSTLLTNLVRTSDENCGAAASIIMKRNFGS